MPGSRRLGERLARSPTQHLIEVGDGARDALLERHARLPAQMLTRTIELGAATQGIVLRQRLAEKVITDLGVGEALVSLLDERGAPGTVGRTLIRPPSSRLGPATKAERKAVMADSFVGDKYDEDIDRESAYEKLGALAEKRAKADAEAEKAELRAKEKAAREKKTSTRSRSTRRKKDSALMREVKREGRLMARRAMRSAVRGILGGLMRR